MKASVIVAVYKDIDALDMVVQSLKEQTYKNFELVITEDAQNKEMKEYIETIKDIEVKHTFQEDMGVRKSRSQNNGILASTGEYLIFIDGDCIPYPEFIASHVTLAEKDCVLSGRRLNLDSKLTKALRFKQLAVKELLHAFWKYCLPLMFDKETRFEQGIYVNPKGLIYRCFFQKAKRNVSILGCNFSCYKKDILAINGFDESYGESAVSDDMDLDWRFRVAGLKLKSCKNAANMYHLFHKAHDRGDASAQVTKMRENEKAQRFVCEKGLNTH
jgi:glycosyltransferase involved in cell wall biosynthesis